MVTRLLLRAGTHGAFLVAGALLLMAAAQPIGTDDLWWHAALGRAYAEFGLWLPGDPLLHTAESAPAAAAWLFDLAVHATGSLGGFQLLRVLHALLVGGILIACWRLFRRASGSASVASLAAAAFVALSAYRLVQLRPELLTIAASLLLYVLVLKDVPVLTDRDRMSPLRVFCGTLLLGVWANLHAGFVLGLVLLATTLAALLVALPWQGEAGPRDRRRAVAIGLVLGLGFIATLLNPDGWSRYQDFVGIGRLSPAVSLVADEWSPLNLFRAPVLDLPPSPTSWLLFWALLVATPLACLRVLRDWSRAPAECERGIDPALVALALVGIAAPLVAVRMSWLSVFPLLLLASCTRRSAAGKQQARTFRRPLATALAAVAVAAGFFLLGDWPMIAGSLRSLTSDYAAPFRPGKYFGHPVWLLRDAGLKGNIFNEYTQGGFLGFWLAPEIRAAANGTLNVTLDAAQSNRAIRARRGARPDESFLELLDRQQIDLFLGIRLPVASGSSRVRHVTTSYLEAASGWLLAFRNLNSAVYVRDNERNARNLAALESWYEQEGVPFDRRRGFDTARVIREAPEWAVRRGVVPTSFLALLEAAKGSNLIQRERSRDRLASVHAILGLYEHAVRLDRRAIVRDPSAEMSRRRLVWSLLRLNRFEEARAAAAEHPADARVDPLSERVFAAATQVEQLPPEEAEALVARLPLFGPVRAAQLSRGTVAPAPRPWPSELESGSGSE